MKRSFMAAEDSDTGIKIYLREIGQIPLLTPQQEIELAAKIKRGDKEARALMIRSNLRLVVKIAHDYANLGLPLLDLISEGNIGLMKAVERFDPAKGGKLSTYAAWWIKQSIKRALAEQPDRRRRPERDVDERQRGRRRVPQRPRLRRRRSEVGGGGDGCPHLRPSVGRGQLLPAARDADGRPLRRSRRCALRRARPGCDAHAAVRADEEVRGYGLPGPEPRGRWPGGGAPVRQPLAVSH